MKKGMLVVVILMVAAGLLVGCGDTTPEVDWDLAVSGSVDTPLSLSYADLAEMEQKELSDILMEKSVGEDTTGSWSGVALADILAKAGAPATFASITAVAGDGYAVEISAAELPDGIVALKENGEWISASDPEHGPIRFVFPHTPANRWVFQLKEIQVNETAAGVPENAAFTVTGLVDAEVGWTEDKLRSFDTIDAESTNKEGETETYTGVAINDLLGKAGPTGEATTLVLVADDGYSAEVDLAEVQACSDCIVSFRNQGGFSSVLPGFSGKAQVKGIVEIQVK